MLRASGTPRVRYLPDENIVDSGSARQVLRASGTYPMRILDRFRTSTTMYLSILPSPPRRSRPLSLEGQRNTWGAERGCSIAAPRVRMQDSGYSARQLPAERGCRIAAPRVRYSARQLPAERGY